MKRIALFGGVYSNYLALAVAIDDAIRRRADSLYCLGDLGAFGPHPDRVFPLLHEYGIVCLQGNYDHSIGHQLDDCRCGYTDPRDNHFAALSYRYTLANTSPANRQYLRGLPQNARLELGPYRLLLCHGSPRRVNEFLWQSATSTAFLRHLCAAHDADVILGTHTGLKWHRPLGTNQHFVNIGVLGRPENDGTTDVWYTMLELNSDDELQVEFVPVRYDHERLAHEMTREQLPPEFIQTIRTGWWTTCLEVLPAKERRAGRF